ncbi:MAG: GDSL-type esterase/lipase family protein [Oscillospiraceae bacterium]|jgi:lysophospholipase L1-like esterase|nr:GDSL-type esterase/lipase family protein [Oscillospiraceae bacterium]
MKTRCIFFALCFLFLCGCAPGTDGGEVTVVFSPIVTSNVVATPEVTPPAATESPEPTEAVEITPVLGETPSAGQGYLDRIIFLGDSTSYGLKYYAKLSGGKETKQVWTPASGTLTLDHQGYATIVYPPTGEEISIRDAVTDAKPEILMITLGVNGVSFLGEDNFKAEYGDLVSDIMEISPDTRIIIQSIFPVAASYEYLKSINNDKINAANGWLRDLALEYGLRYLDTASVLAVGTGGFLPETYHNGDGIHLNGETFTIVLDYIKTHALPGYAIAPPEFGE